MDTIANPLYTSMVPGMNPTGTSISTPSIGPTAGGANPFLATSSASGLGANAMPTNANPYSAGTSVPGFSANSGPYSSSLNLGTNTGGPFGGSPSGGPLPGMASPTGIGGMSSMTPQQQQRMLLNLTSTYGRGMGLALYNFLASGAGYNQQAINNLLASMQPGIERGAEGISEQFAALGAGDSSGAQIGLGDYYSQVSLDEGQLVSQMYEQAINDYINTLMGTSSGVADKMAAKPSGWDSASGILSLISSGAGGALAGLGAAGSGAGGAGAALAGLAAL